MTETNANNPRTTPPLPPTPPMPPKPPVNPIVETAGERRSRRRRVAFAAGALAVVATTAVGAPAAVRAMSGETSTASAPRAAQIEDAGDPLTLDLGDVTLDELAAELADMGLELRIGSTSVMRSELDHDEAGRIDGSDDDLYDGDLYDGDEEDFSDEDFDEDFGDFDDGDVDDHDHDHDHSGDEETLGAFPIDGDRIDLSSASSPEVAEQAREIWARFVELIPADERQMVTSFELVPEEFGGAYVYPADDPTKWVLGVGLGLGEDLDFVLVHEFAHLLTLKASEVPPTTGEAGCTTYFTGEGCAVPGSVMDEFVERFWPQSQIDLIRNATEAGDWDALDDFYSDNHEDFVTDYAITNPAEDVADTFATFVTEDQPDNLGSPDLTLAEQKVEFFWSIPEMVELRAEIRASL